MTRRDNIQLNKRRFGNINTTASVLLDFFNTTTNILSSLWNQLLNFFTNVRRRLSRGRSGGGSVLVKQCRRVVLGHVVVEVVFAREPLVTHVALDLVGRVHEAVSRQHPARRKRLPTNLALVLRRGT